MTHETTQPTLGDLLTRYLQKQADACAVEAAANPDEVTPYDAGPVQPIDPKLAWDEALAVIALSGSSSPQRGTKAPPGWPGLVAGHEPVLALAMCSGNFPQLVRNFHMILQTTDLAALLPQAGRSLPAPELAAWADDVADRRQFPQVLLALGALRLAKQLTAADAYVARHDVSIPADWRAAWENEKAALAWHAGRAEQALAAWQQQVPSVAVLFNRGMAELFLGQLSAARTHLADAVARLPETSGWHHLGRLYLALAKR
jgi:tetratricopeptide (TPR) repeat protein